MKEIISEAHSVHNSPKPHFTKKEPVNDFDHKRMSEYLSYLNHNRKSSL